MSDRDTEIIEAAVALFLRYGVKRTGMKDIAGALGISRQTLYNAFANKDEVLRATIRLFTARAMADIEDGLQSRTSLGDQIDVIFEHFVVRPFKMLHTTPNAQDIVSGMNAASREEIAANDQAFRAILARTFSPHEKSIAKAGLSSKELAEVTQLAVSTAKEKATSQRHLNQLLRSQRAVVLSIAQA